MYRSELLSRKYAERESRLKGGNEGRDDEVRWMGVPDEERMVVVGTAGGGRRCTGGMLPLKLWWK